jgi:ABC-2 type transport system permease protein
MLGQDELSVLEVTAFGGLWNTVVPAVGVLAAFTFVLGGVAVSLVNRAVKAEGTER